MSNKVYKMIQDKFINSIQDVIDGKETLLPWQKPWKGSMPRNYVSGKIYSGVNLLLLEGGEWLTFNQIKTLSKKDNSIKLKKGSKASKIIFWKMLEKEDDKKEIKTIPMLRYFNVFNIGDVEGLESKLPERKDIPNNEELDKVINDYKTRENLKIKFLDGSNRAYYSPTEDKVVMPLKNQFQSQNKYYSTFFHELAHSTGHIKRLARFDSSKIACFGSEDYSKEELIAEISSQMALGRLNIQDESIHNNSLTYVNGWMKAIKNDVGLIISASSSAQKACDYMLGEI